MYIWQNSDWPSFAYDISNLEEILYRYALEIGSIMGRFEQVSEELQMDAMIDLMIQESINTSAIEGEKISYDDVRSSIRNQLRLEEHLPHNHDPRAMGIAQLMVNNRKTFKDPLTKEMLCHWHEMVMASPADQERIIDVGQWRSPQTDPMQIVSGSIEREMVHYEAPSSHMLETEMNHFIEWFNATSPDNGAVVIAAPIRAAIAHLYFECIHPFADGNGRIGRVLSEKVLSQEIGAPILFGLSNTIYKNRGAYYQALSLASNNGMIITSWIEYFVKTIYNAQLDAKDNINFVLKKSKFWKKYAALLNERQEKVLSRMLQEGPIGFKGGISPKKYIKITQCSKATATRDLGELLELGCLIQLPGSGRSTSYDVNLM